MKLNELMKPGPAPGFALWAATHLQINKKPAEFIHGNRPS